MTVNSEIVFGAMVAVEKEQAKLAETHDLMRWKKDAIARDLGIEIAEEKGWIDYEEGDMMVSNIRLYIFTPAELTDYMHAKFKAKLQHMAATEEYLTDEQRNALMIQSERF